MVFFSTALVYPLAMRKESMTPKERWMAVLRHRKPDRIPMDYWGTDEATEKMMKHLGCGTMTKMLKKLHVDYLVELKPRYVGPKLPKGHDVFGRVYRDVDYGTGVYAECISHPLSGYGTVGEIEKNYVWPDPDWWDVSFLAEQLKGHEGYPARAGHYEPFLIYKDLRGDEQAFLDLLIHPDMVHYCLDKMLHLDYVLIRRMYETLPGRISLTYVAEDMGGQDDLMISPEHIHEFLLPRMKKVMDLVHGAGAYVFHHTDGASRKILPDMIEAGIDLLNPIQWRCPGMEREGLKRDFGDKIVFHGAVDNQYTLPFGSVDEVRREVMDNLHILGYDGRYILAPCHNIQAVSPPENIIAMYETGYAEGWL
jgi:uroporphyrinogen decarboxylase